jgi:hypothetical protein
MNALNLQQVTTLNIYQSHDLLSEDKIILEDPIAIDNMKREVIMLSGLFLAFS